MKKILILSLGLLTLAGSQAFTLPTMPESVKNTYNEAIKYVPTKEAVGQAWIVQKGLEYVPSQETVVATANSAKDALVDGATVAKDVVIDKATMAKNAVVDAAQEHPYIAGLAALGVAYTGIFYATVYKRYKNKKAALIAATGFAGYYTALVGAGYAAYTFCPEIDLSSIQR
ncbi:hypothetical protein HOM50_02510 [bacterium]|nr:hypothetical protein [bacterium]MBT5015255.1 hypothetical protein [bacterium]